MSWWPRPGDHTLHILAATSWRPRTDNPVLAALFGIHILAATSWRPHPSSPVQVPLNILEEQLFESFEKMASSILLQQILDLFQEGLVDPHHSYRLVFKGLLISSH